MSPRRLEEGKFDWYNYADMIGFALACRQDLTVMACTCSSTLEGGNYGWIRMEHLQPGMPMQNELLVAFSRLGFGMFAHVSGDWCSRSVMYHRTQEWCLAYVVQWVLKVLMQIMLQCESFAAWALGLLWSSSIWDWWIYLFLWVLQLRSDLWVVGEDSYSQCEWKKLVVVFTWKTYLQE